RWESRSTPTFKRVLIFESELSFFLPFFSGRQEPFWGALAPLPGGVGDLSGPVSLLGPGGP
ncbi:MAG: hypothetical protein ACEPOZ_15880, partial [Marinifilaceae bacterium]